MVLFAVFHVSPAASHPALEVLKLLDAAIFNLIVGRALMGVGGAMMWPAILGMTYGLLPPGAIPVLLPPVAAASPLPVC